VGDVVVESDLNKTKDISSLIEKIMISRKNDNNKPELATKPSELEKKEA
jgi:hypothetical protein